MGTAVRKAAPVLVILCSLLLGDRASAGTIGGARGRGAERVKAEGIARARLDKQRVGRARALRPRVRLRPGGAKLRRSANQTAQVRPAPIRRAGTRRTSSGGGTRTGLMRIRAVSSFFERALRWIIPGRRATDLSISGLTLTNAQQLRAAAGAAAPALGAVTGVAGIALAAASLWDLRRAGTGLERADAMHSLAWGLQSIGALGGVIFDRGLSAATALGFGVGGGAVQTGVGLYRLYAGVRGKDRRSVLLGVLDTSAGVAWLASTVAASPVALAAFLGLTTARLIYTNWHRIVRMPAATARLFRRATGGARRLATGAGRRLAHR